MKKFKKLTIPYLVWMFALVVIPLALMVVMSFMDMYMFKITDAKFSVDHFDSVFNTTYLKAFLKSMKLASIATIGCILLGYPVAYIVSKLKFANKGLLLVVFILPMWTNMLLRIETINKMLKPNGFMRNVFGLALNYSGTEIAVIIVMIIVYIPFMIFPIYTVLEKIDYSLIEASMDLGANPRKSFMKVTLPLSMKGISSGIMMVFLPCAMGFTIPQIISNGNIKLIGNIIEDKFKGNSGEYNVGMLASLVIIAFVLFALWVIGKIDEEGETLL